MTSRIFSALARLIALGVIGLALGGCALGPDRRDPFEPFNRGALRFNDEVDTVVLKPVAIVYRDVVPALVRTGVNNFFGNLGDAWSAVNNLLQFKPRNAAENIMRVSINTVLGLGGVLDVASETGLERHREDFGQTLGRWGVPPGPYLVLPVFGPSTVRDAASLLVDRQGDPVRASEPASARTALYSLRVLDTRATLLRASNVLDQVALDRYTFIRDAHLQRRQAEIVEGEPETPADEPQE